MGGVGQDCASVCVFFSHQKLSTNSSSQVKKKKKKEGEFLAASLEKNKRDYAKID